MPKEPNCPNCGGKPGDQYYIGEGMDFKEFRCDNENCRCMVFRT